jgi:hypothetical protein
MSVDAFCIHFFNFFIDEKENYTEIEKREDVSNQGVPDIEVENFFYLSYLPTGYRFKSYTIVGDSIIVQYSSQEEIIIFNQSKGDANYQIDTEDADIIVVISLCKKARKESNEYFNFITNTQNSCPPTPINRYRSKGSFCN